MKPNPYSRQTFNRNAVGVKDFPAIYQYECTGKKAEIYCMNNTIYVNPRTILKTFKIQF